MPLGPRFPRSDVILRNLYIEQLSKASVKQEGFGTPHASLLVSAVSFFLGFSFLLSPPLPI